jgi:hypothetical protein
MHGSQADGQRQLAGQQAFDDFGREGREGGQTAEKTGDREQFPGHREMRVHVENADRHADQIAADHIGRQRAERQGDETAG